MPIVIPDIVAYFTPSSQNSKAGTIQCAICPSWTFTLTTPPPTLDEAVTEHLTAIHENVLNGGEVHHGPRNRSESIEDYFGDPEVECWVEPAK